MLYNKDWDKKDVNSLDNLIDWLEGQDPTKWYSYRSSRGCLLAQYYSAHGYCNVKMGRDHFFYTEDYGRPGYQYLPEGFDKIARGGLFTNTIGHALNRALKYKKALETNGIYALAV